MKKLIILLSFVVLLLVGCSNGPEIQTIDVAAPGIERVKLGNGYSYLIDSQGVMYLERKAGYQYGLSIMLNPDGTPRIYYESGKD